MYSHGSEAGVYVDFEDLFQYVEPGSSIFVDDAMLELEVQAVSQKVISTVAKNSATLGTKKVGVETAGLLAQGPAACPGLLMSEDR